MTLQELLAKGYFPKELPPPFQTEVFTNNFAAIVTGWAAVLAGVTYKTAPEKEVFKKKYFDSKWVKYSIRKFGFSRRALALPNPYHQAILSQSVVDNYPAIELLYAKSNMSYSKPITDPTFKRAMKMSHNFSEFKNHRVLDSFDKAFEVKTDISRYYSTIYTHSIAWAMHTKPIAKAQRLIATFLGNILDKNVRIGNSSQTIGIPIGPDTSLILSEIIGCTMDEFFQNEFSGQNILAFRYVDDYYVYCTSQIDAERVIKFLQQIFADFQLEMNEEKTKIARVPFPFENRWVIELGSFTFESKTAKSQQLKIERFVSLAFIHAIANPDEHVLSYAIGILRNLNLFDDSWTIYESLILKMALTEPAILGVVAQILVSYKPKVDAAKVGAVAINILQEHISKGHHYEVSWCLWLCKEFEVFIPTELANAIFISEDVISILIALDLKNLGFIMSNSDVSAVETELTPESLMEEKWLLTYESIFKGWLPTPVIDPLTQNEYFNLLAVNGVYFYDQNKKLVPFNVIRAEDEIERARLKKLQSDFPSGLANQPDIEGYDSGVEVPPKQVTDHIEYES